MKNNNSQMTKIKRKILQGKVVSDKMNKTIVVEVEKRKIHPLYKKRYLRNKKYKIHDEKNQAKLGDVVSFVSCRPLSRDKKWRLKEIISK